MKIQDRPLFTKTFVPITSPNEPGFHVVTRKVARHLCREDIATMAERLKNGHSARSKRRHGNAGTIFSRRWSRACHEILSAIKKTEDEAAS